MRSVNFPLWFQLASAHAAYAQSLGKRSGRGGAVRKSGPTPIVAVGATDQHAQMQLFMEGPRNKLVTFIEVAHTDADLTVPDSQGPTSYLSDKTLGQLLSAERRGSAEALAQDKRPSVTLSLPRLDATELGGLLFLHQAVTAFSGELYGINAFDQPGVELGKRLAFGLLGRAGYEEEARALSEQASAARARYRV